jgi:hypothetical protein
MKIELYLCAINRAPLLRSYLTLDLNVATQVVGSKKQDMLLHNTFSFGWFVYSKQYILYEK